MKLSEIANKKFYYILVLVLISVSGFPIWRRYDYIYIFLAAFICLWFCRHWSKIKHFKMTWRYIGILVLIFICQTIIFQWNTLPGIVNHIAKTLCGCFVISLLDKRFKYYYLRVIYHLSIIALFFWLLKLSYGILFNLIGMNGDSDIIIYFSRENEPIRNCGQFWEPGAFGCYLLFAFMMFHNNIAFLRKNIKVTITCFLALLSTMSTTAYVSFAVLITLVYLFQVKSFIKYPLIAMSIIIGQMVYYQIDFLSEKIDYQTEMSLNADGEYSAHRLGSLLFDMYYIKKHPLVGNGLHERTRYADHQYLVPALKNGDLHASGNGFSIQFAKFGLLFYITYLIIFFKSNKTVSYKNKMIFLILFLLLLQGEDLFRYPFASGLLLLKLDPIEEL